MEPAHAGLQAASPVSHVGSYRDATGREILRAVAMPHDPAAVVGMDPIHVRVACDVSRTHRDG